MKGSKIIIKKVKKRGHEGGHGGSWKVAYADFVTAMMAFFLLLWLLSMVSDDRKASLANYFKFFAIFDEPGKTIMSGSMDMMDQGAGVAEYQVEAQGPKTDVTMGEGSIKVMSPEFSDKLGKEELMEKLKEDIEKKLSDVKDQVMVDVVEGGVRIQLVDKEGGKSMFPLGASEPTIEAKMILRVIADNVKTVQNKVSIEGHTDSLSYSSSKYTNWELSTDRASAARKELERNGMSPDRISKVAGYAATIPLIESNPADPRNRRISIMLYFDESSKGKDEKELSGLKPIGNPVVNP